MRSNNSPGDDRLSGSNNLRGSGSVLEDREDDHDPLTLYAANSAEYMLRWPVFNKVITDSERHIRSFLLDSLDSQPQSGMPPPRQLGIGPLLDDIQILCKKYLRLIHRRNPVVDKDKLERYAREVTVQGLGWDGPSCQVVRIHHCSRPIEFRLCKPYRDIYLFLFGRAASCMRTRLRYL
jgi:hypothetical protein